MSYRFMRIIVMFDLPVVTSVERQEYTKFRKFLLKSGFIMMQESVYTKIALNTSVADGIMQQVRNHKPPRTSSDANNYWKTISKMELVVGEEHKDVIDNDERLIILWK